MDSIHNVRARSLSQVIQFSNDRTKVEIEVKCWSIPECMEQDCNLGRNRLGGRVFQSNIHNDSINQGTLGEFIGSILELLDVYSDIVSRVALIFDVQARFLNLTNGSLELLVILA